MVLPSLKSIFMEMSQQVDEKELEMGLEKEMERTDDSERAKAVVLHHLRDLHNYYSLLRKFETEEAHMNDISSSGQFSASI